MKKILTLTVGLLIVASAAMAQDGLYLTATDCTVGSSVHQIAPANCTTNTGQYGSLVASIILGHAIPRWVAVGTVIDMQSSTAVVPDWWRVDAGGPCASRQGAVTAVQDGTAAANCASVWDGLGTVTPLFIAQYAPMPNAPTAPNRIRFNALAAILAPAATDVTGEELAVLKLTIAKTGTTTCPGGGCLTPVTFQLNEVNFTSDVPGAEVDRITNPGAPGSAACGGQGPPDAGNPTATQNRTWGAVKALYR